MSTANQTTVLPASTLKAFGMALVAACLLLLVFHQSAASMVHIWWRSETFTHGFFVLPIFFWLLWRLRDELATIRSRPDWLAIPCLLVAGFLWLLSSLASIQAGEHIALVMMLICVIWGVVGRDITRKIQFPLLFLFFMAPVGQELVPLLMNITADLTVNAIQLTGIPIYREGLFFSLPSGNWSVVEACSGIRYLIASLTLGTLYAYLTYDRMPQRLLFILIAAVVPIGANAIRAFMIVMIGHHSGMKLATGVDHLVYGWLFFGVVMFILFSLGALIKTSNSKDHASSAEAGTDNEPGAKVTRQSPNPLTFALTLVTCIAVWPIWSYATNLANSSIELDSQTVELLLPGGSVSDETEDQADSQSVSKQSGSNTWKPIISGYDAYIENDQNNDQSNNRGNASGSKPKARVYVYVQQSQGREMINSSNILTDGSTWRLAQRTIYPVVNSLSTTDVPALEVEESLLKSSTSDLLVWQWYKVGERNLQNKSKVKLYELMDKLLLRKSISSTYILSVRNSDGNRDREQLTRMASEIINQSITP